MRNRMLSYFVAMAVCVGVVYAADPPVPTIETQAFLDNNPESRMALSGTRVVALYGVPFEKNTSPCPSTGCTSTDDFVSTFVTNNADAFGVTNCTLVADNYCTGAPADKCTQDSDCDTGQTCDNQITISNGKFTVYSYIQHIEGLPVHSSKVNIPVLHMTDEERIGHVIIRLIPHPANPLPSQNEISATTAINVVSNSALYQHLTDFSSTQEAEKVVFEASDKTLHRAWRFMGWDDDEAYHFFVDTTSQAIAGAQSLGANAGEIKAKVTGLRTPGTASISPGAGICSGAAAASCSDINPCRGSQQCILDLSRLPVVIDPDGSDGVWEGMQVELFDDMIPPTLVSTLLTNSVGEVTFTGLDDLETYTLESILEGPWVKVFNIEGTDLKATASQVTPTARPATPVDLIFNPDGDPPVERPIETAQANAFTVVNKTHDWFLGLQPTFTGINIQVEARVNIDLPCNALALGVMPPRLLFGKADTLNANICTNTAFSTIISHEYGHVLLRLAGKSAYGTYGEGFADTIATLLWDTHCIGEDIYQPTPHGNGDICLRNVDAVPSGFDGDSTLICPGGCEVKFGEQFCLNPHCEGLALAGAFWDMRNALLYCSGTTTACNDDSDCVSPATCSDDSITEEIVSAFMFLAEPIGLGELNPSMVVDVLFADDIDADLRNGTPHCREIICAFSGDSCNLNFGCDMSAGCVGISNHEWPCPVIVDDGRVSVEWLGPPANRCPIRKSADIGCLIHRNTNTGIQYGRQPFTD